MANILVYIGYGAIFSGGALLIVVLLARILYPLKILLNRDDDYLKYENEQGKRVVRRSTLQMSLLGLFLIFSGFVMILGSDWLKNGSQKDGNRFFDGEGIGIDLDITPDNELRIDDTIYSYYIVISGDDISINGEDYISLAEFSKKSEHFLRNTEFYIVDDYALLSTYREVTKIIVECGCTYIQE